MTIACVVIGIGGTAQGQATPPPLSQNPRLDGALSGSGPGHLFQLPHTMAELGFGLLTLPGADVCLNDPALRAARCSKGDSSIAVSFWQMYRPNERWGIGAGATMAVVPRTDDFSAQTAGIARSHSRSFFLVEGQGRFYFLQRGWVSMWLGSTAGIVIVSDRYVNDTKPVTDAAILGPRSATLRSEGIALGLLTGGNWSFSPTWAIGGSMRVGRWFLPGEPSVSVLGDRTTLTSQQTVVEMMFTVTYRIFHQFGSRGAAR